MVEAAMSANASTPPEGTWRSSGLTRPPRPGRPRSGIGPPRRHAREDGMPRRPHPRRFRRIPQAVACGHLRRRADEVVGGWRAGDGMGEERDWYLWQSRSANGRAIWSG